MKSLLEYLQDAQSRAWNAADRTERGDNYRRMVREALFVDKLAWQANEFAATEVIRRMRENVYSLTVPSYGCPKTEHLLNGEGYRITETVDRRVRERITTAKFHLGYGNPDYTPTRVEAEIGDTVSILTYAMELTEEQEDSIRRYMAEKGIFVE